MHACLNNWRLLANSIGNHPTSLQDVVPTAPAFIGMYVASQAGMVVVWLPISLAPDPTAPPLLWCIPFTLEVQAQLMSDDNPTGLITNSSLKLMEMVAHTVVLAQASLIWDHTIWIGCDNTG